MSLHALHTDSGMRPTDCRRPKIQHPRQNASADFERRGDDDEADEHPGDRRGSRRVRDERTDRERRADPLREALGRSGDEARGPEPGCDHALREPPEDRQTRSP